MDFPVLTPGFQSSVTSIKETQLKADKYKTPIGEMSYGETRQISYNDQYCFRLRVDLFVCRTLWAVIFLIMWTFPSHTYSVPNLNNRIKTACQNVKSTLDQSCVWIKIYSRTWFHPKMHFQAVKASRCYTRPLSSLSSLTIWELADVQCSSTAPNRAISDPVWVWASIHSSEERQQRVVQAPSGSTSLHLKPSTLMSQPTVEGSQVGEARALGLLCAPKPDHGAFEDTTVACCFMQMCFKA